jgi:hypothetical protein
MRRLMMTQDLYTQKRSLELDWQQEHLKEGRYTLHMGHIDKKIQEIVKEIIAKEFEEQTLRTKIAEAKAEVSIAT